MLRVMVDKKLQERLVQLGIRKVPLLWPQQNQVPVEQARLASPRQSQEERLEAARTSGLTGETVLRSSFAGSVKSAEMDVQNESAANSSSSVARSKFGPSFCNREMSDLLQKCALPKRGDSGSGSTGASVRVTQGDVRSGDERTLPAALRGLETGRALRRAGSGCSAFPQSMSFSMASRTSCATRTPWTPPGSSTGCRGIHYPSSDHLSNPSHHASRNPLKAFSPEAYCRKPDQTSILPPGSSAMPHRHHSKSSKLHLQIHPYPEHDSALKQQMEKISEADNYL